LDCALIPRHDREEAVECPTTILAIALGVGPDRRDRLHWRGVRRLFLREPIEQRLGFLQVGAVQTLGEPTVDID
jgi:hypothetical protein